MTYIGKKYYRVILTLNYALHLQEIINLVKEYGGEYMGRETDEGVHPIIIIFDFKNEPDALQFIKDARNDDNFKRSIINARHYSDWRYDD